MPGRLCGWHTIIRGKQTREVHTVVRLLLGILGLLMCVAGCAGPNPFVRARPPDALAWEEARRADSAYFYQRFLTQYPTSAFARLAHARLEALDWAVVQQIDGMPDYARFIQAYPDSVRVPQAQARLTELAARDDSHQHAN